MSTEPQQVAYAIIRHSVTGYTYLGARIIPVIHAHHAIHRVEKVEKECGGSMWMKPDAKGYDAERDLTHDAS